MDSSLKFEKGDELPVLDGAAALVPVYASVIDNCYPEGSVTYEGGGPSKLINPLVRIKGSGSQTMMEKFMGKDIVLTHNPMNILGGPSDIPSDIICRAWSPIPVLRCSQLTEYTLMQRTSETVHIL